MFVIETRKDFSFEDYSSHEGESTFYILSRKEKKTFPCSFFEEEKKEINYFFFSSKEKMNKRDALLFLSERKKLCLSLLFLGKYKKIMFMKEYHPFDDALLPFSEIKKFFKSFENELRRYSPLMEKEKITNAISKSGNLIERRDYRRADELLSEISSFGNIFRYEDAYSYWSSPHAFSGYISYEEKPTLNKIQHPKLKENPVFRVSDIHKKMKYQSKKLTTSIHCGQRKLFLELFVFLTLNYSHDKKNILIYPGAAPGVNIGIVSRFFPDVEYILIDPNPFNIKKRNQFTLINDYFTNEMCELFAKKYPKEEYNILLVSDIRAIDQSRTPPSSRIEKLKNSLETDIQVVSDNFLQEEWVRILKPNVASLKFRLPYDSELSLFNYQTLKDKKYVGVASSLISRLEEKYHPIFDSENKFVYLDGECFVQQWAPRGSTETRLIVTDPESRKGWDCVQYEEKLSYYNNKLRRSLYSVDKDYLFFSEGYDCCGDCKSEILILEEYILSQRDTYIKVEEDLLQIFGRVVDDKTLIERRLYSLEPIDFEEIKLRTSVINLGYYLSHLLGKRKLCECQPSNPNFRGKMGKVTHSKAAPNSIF